MISPEMGGGFGLKIALLARGAGDRGIGDRARAAGALDRRARREPDRRAACARGGDRDARRGDARRAASSRSRRSIAADFGAYCFFPANYMARVIAMILPGPYRIPAYGYDVKVYLTTKCPAGPMRAPMAIGVVDHGGNDRRDRARR